MLLLDCRAVFDIEYTALKVLAETDEKLAAEGVALWLAGLNREVLRVVRRSPFGRAARRRRMFANLDAAVREFEAQFQ